MMDVIEFRKCNEVTRKLTLFRHILTAGFMISYTQGKADYVVWFVITALTKDGSEYECRVPVSMRVLGSIASQALLTMVVENTHPPTEEETHETSHDTP